MKNDRAATAESLKQLLIMISPLIEEYTATVCPQCTDVCCRQKHGVYREIDVQYFHAMGILVPLHDEHRPAEWPCERLGPRGCLQPRWLRPFKCTWYFCDPLLAALNAGSQKKVRKLIALLQEMKNAYDTLNLPLPDELKT